MSVGIGYVRVSVFVLIGLTLSAGQTARGQVPEQFLGIRKSIEDRLSKEKVPSVAVAVAKDGKLLWEDAVGWADVENHPLVGRDVLLGVLGAVGAVLTIQIGRLAPTWLGQVPAWPLLVLNTDVFTNVPGLVFLWVTHSVPAMAAFFFVFMCQVVLRREWLVAAAWALVGAAAFAWGAEPFVLSVTFQTLHQLVLVVLLLQFGFLTFATAFICIAALTQAPLTTDLSAWYVGTGALYALVLAGTAVYGFITSLGGRQVFREGVFGDE